MVFNEAAGTHPERMKRTVFSIPFNGDLALAGRALASGKVSEVYFSPWDRGSLLCNYYGGSERRPPAKKVFASLRGLCAAQGAALNVLCNSPVLPPARYNAAFAGIRALGEPDAITLSDPTAINAFRREFPRAELQASFIMNLDNPRKVRHALEAGIGAITLPAALNRDGEALEELRAMKKDFPAFRVKLIANLDCFPDCIYLASHYMHGALLAALGLPDSEDEEAPDRQCHMAYGSPAGFIRVPFIRPEDTAWYAGRGWCDSFKLIYRSFPSPALEKIFGAYFSGGFKGNLFEIVPSKDPAYESSRGKTGPAAGPFCDNSRFPRGFAAKVCACGRSCKNCGYCGRVAERTACAIP